MAWHCVLLLPTRRANVPNVAPMNTLYSDKETTEALASVTRQTHQDFSPKPLPRLGPSSYHPADPGVVNVAQLPRWTGLSTPYSFPSLPHLPPNELSRSVCPSQLMKFHPTREDSKLGRGKNTRRANERAKVGTRAHAEEEGHE